MQHQDNNTPSASLQAMLAKAREDAQKKGLYLTDDDIESYARGDLDAETTAILELRMTQDPDFAAEVNAEMGLADGIRGYARTPPLERVHPDTNHEVAKAPVPMTATVSNTPAINWRRWLVAASIALLCGVLVWGIWPPPPKNKGFISRSLEDTVAVDNTVPTNSMVGRNTPDAPTSVHPTIPSGTSLTDRLALWAASIVSIEVTQQEQAVAMKGRSTNGNINLKPPSKLTIRDRFSTGVVAQIAGKKYVLASSEAVSLAANTPTAIVAHDFNRNKFDLRLIGKDDLFGVAVLELTAAATPTPPGLVLAPKNSAEKNSSVWMFGNPLDKQRIGQKAVNGKLDQAQNGCILVQTPSAWPSADGTLINDQGQITGLISPFARAAFPQQKNDKTERFALTADFINEIAQRIIEENPVQKPYLGIDFEQIASANEVKAYKVLPGSPASPYADELLNQRIDSINSKSVKNLIEVSTVLSRIPSKSVVLLTHSPIAGGPKKVQRIYSKTLDAKAFEAIADAMVEDMPGFSMVFSPGSPQVEYKGAAFENGIYYVQAVCRGNGRCPDNILTKADLGAHIQGMALLNDGRLRLYSERKNREMEHTISFNNNRLCH